jgi:hypothetical protein
MYSRQPFRVGSRSSITISKKGFYYYLRTERQTVNVKVTTVLGSIPASTDTVKSEEQQMTSTVLNKVLNNIFKNPPEKQRFSSRHFLLAIMKMILVEINPSF